MGKFGIKISHGNRRCSLFAVWREKDREVVRKAKNVVLTDFQLCFSHNGMQIFAVFAEEDRRGAKKGKN